MSSSNRLARWLQDQATVSHVPPSLPPSSRATSLDSHSYSGSSSSSDSASTIQDEPIYPHHRPPHFQQHLHEYGDHEPYNRPRSTDTPIMNHPPLRRLRSYSFEDLPGTVRRRLYHAPDMPPGQMPGFHRPFPLDIHPLSLRPSSSMAHYGDSNSGISPYSPLTPHIPAYQYPTLNPQWPPSSYMPAPPMIGPEYYRGSASRSSMPPQSSISYNPYANQQASIVYLQDSSGEPHWHKSKLEKHHEQKPPLLKRLFGRTPSSTRKRSHSHSHKKLSRRSSYTSFKSHNGVLDNPTAAYYGAY